MQLVQYRYNGADRAGLLIGEQVYDLANAVADAKFSAIEAVLDDWSVIEGRLPHLERESGIALAEVSLLAPVSARSTVFCAGANYRDHSAEMAALHSRPTPSDPHARGEKPWHFIKASQSITDPGSVIELPHGSKEVDWEAELVAVIGKTCRNATLDNALNHVLGYTIANDLSARDLSRRNAPEGSPFRFDWLSHKSFDGALPLGPAITLARDIGEPQSLAISLKVNGVTKQNSSTAQMTFSVAEQIVHLSRHLTLWPGDLLLTGTPAGVGAARGEFLAGGETVEVTIEKIGTLTNSIASRS